MEIKKQDGTTIPKENGIFIVDFGNIPRNSDTTTELIFTGNNIETFNISVTCGCSSAGNKKINNNLWHGSVRYKNTDTPGVFAKTIKLNYTENRETKNEQLKIKGTVL